MIKSELLKILSHYNLGNIKKIEQYGHGRINRTFKLTFEDENKQTKQYIFQQINNDVFSDVAGLMNNIHLVSEHLQTKIKNNNGNPLRECLTIVNTNSDDFFVNFKQRYYRIYNFISNSVCYQQTENNKMFLESGKKFGEFQNMLADFDATNLVETIPNFHNTKNRYIHFLETVDKNNCKRNEKAEKEIDFVNKRCIYAYNIVDMLSSGELPIRVTHNDTKLNNIVFDKITKKPLAVLDLDTVMPGAMCYDFGDAIRFGCNTASEEEKDYKKVKLNLRLFESYVKGFCSAVGNSMTTKEMETLVDGCMTITYELGLRFLTDYLEGDKYFGVTYEDNNLVRARNQFKLLCEMEKHENEMRKIVQTYCEPYLNQKCLNKDLKI